MNNQQIEHTHDDDKVADSGHSQPQPEPLQVYKPRLWLGVLVTSSLAAAGIGGFAWLYWSSLAFSEVTDGLKFLTEGSIALALLIVAAAQACVYWSQRGIMRAQSQTMVDGLRRTDRMIDKMQDQLDAINKQEGHLATQAEAAKTQAEVMARQTTIMDKTLVYGTRAYVGIKDLVADYRARRIHLYIENVGRVPANNIQVTLELRVQILRNLLPLTQPPTGWGAIGYDPDCWGITIPFLHAYGKRTKLFPRQPLDIVTFIEPYHLSRSEIMLVEQGEGVRVRIRGEVRYSDGFHKDKVTHYDFRYLGGEWVPQQIDDPVGQYSDQYKPDTDYEPS